jgi:hypothetical protein
MITLKRIWQRTAPNIILVGIRFLFESPNEKVRRKAVLKHFKKFDLKTLSPEIREGLRYLKFHKFSAYPYRWALKYDNIFPKVYRDTQHQCYYVLYEGKRMYFPKRYTESQVIWVFRSINKEQDSQSPHLYLTTEFQVDLNSIVVDAGVAEGNFALSVVEKAKLLYLIECDTEWMEALRLTFAPWKEKVVFVEKLISDTESALTTSIDSLIKPISNEKYFIKMDIEGYEQKALIGMENLVASGCNIKMDVCTYHHANDLQEIETIISDYGFNWSVSESFMLFFRPEELPSFRKVLIRAEKF